MLNSSGLFGSSTHHARPKRMATVQIPSSADLESMKGLPAGQDEDQATRLTSMSAVLQQSLRAQDSIRLINNSNVALSDEWETIFELIDHGEGQTAVKLYRKLPDDEAIKFLLSNVHTNALIESLITACAHAQPGIASFFSADVRVNRGSFTTLIRDLALALNNPGILLAFGLPTHHAYSDSVNGFCLLNKTAMLVRQCQMAGSIPVIVGTDVNRDDGLNQILTDDSQDLPFIHLDICDTRVYPWDSIPTLLKTLSTKGFTYQQKQYVHVFSRGDQQYLLIDLQSFKHESVSMHSALAYAERFVRDCITTAESKQQTLQLFLPTGWDSHQDETAACSTWLNQRATISAHGQRTQRFNNADFELFFESLFANILQHPSTVLKVFFSLEGGYEPDMYPAQIKTFIQALQTQLKRHETTPHPHAVSKF